jgi:hypothetical protein
MGLTRLKVAIANPARPRQALEVTSLADCAAVYAVVPDALLRKLRARAHSKGTFLLADGSEIARRMGAVLFRLDGRQGAATVIFGEKEDRTLPGTCSLDPVKRELRRLPMILASEQA